MENQKKYLRLNDIDSYRTAFHLSNYLWKIIITWPIFARDTIGKQFIRSVDSISANIAEGFGRFGKKEKIQFYRYAKGSLVESLDWNEKSQIRQLLSSEQYNYIFNELQKLPNSINTLIKYTNDKLES
jgi:four helix bundle protein